MEELLSPKAVAEAGYFDAAAVEKLVQKCRHQEVLGFRDNMSLVGILSVQMLDRQFVRPSREGQIAPAAVSYEDGIKS